MKVRATAVGEERSNAIGSVELECTPFGLVIAYLGVGAFSEGYAPGALTSGTLVSVPYPGIRLARFEGPRLYLEVAPEITPHHKLVLTDFTVGDGTHRHELYRQRLVLRTGAFAFALIAALLAALLVPRVSPGSGAAAALSIAMVAAATVLGLGFFLDRKLISGQLEGEAAQNALAAELRMVVPGLVRLDRPAPRPTRPLPLPDFQGMLPRTTAAIVITLTAGGLAAVLISKWMLTAPDAFTSDIDPAYAEQAASPPDDQQRPGNVPDLDAPEISAAAVTPAPAATMTSAPPAPTSAPPVGGPVSELARGGACQCQRTSSALWEQPVPKLSVLVLSTKLRQNGSRKHLELDIAVVNNSSEELFEVTLRVNFFERDPAPTHRRHFSRHRVLFFEGPLLPGQAIKWSTEARGVEFELENPVAGDIGPGGDSAAPADAFAELLNANHRPVRLHGAMMLAYLGDPRAREGALKLQDALREEEASYLRRVLGALSDVRVCEVKVSGNGGTRQLSACVFNASDSPRDGLAVKLNALETPLSLAHPVGEPPTILGELKWGVPGSLAAQQGARIQTSVDLEGAKASTARAFELLAGPRGEVF